MSEVTDSVEADITDESQGMPDPMRDIIEVAAQEYVDEIEGLQGGDTEESGAAPETSQYTSSEEGETGIATSPEADETDGGKRPGIDETLQVVESQVGKNHADVIRSVLTSYQDARSGRDEVEGMQQELQDSLEEVQALRENLSRPREQPKPDPNDPLSKVSKDQWDLFHRMAEQQGLVRKDQLEAEERAYEARSFIEDDRDDGLEKFGEEFGAMDEGGQFHYHPEVIDDVQAIHDRFSDKQRGPTGQDYYVLARHDQLVGEAFNRGKAEANEPSGNGRPSPQERATQARRAMVERNSAPSNPTTSKVYDRSNGPVNLDDVVARAAAAAYRDLPRQRETG
jgi:hypothetical protein